MADVAAPVNTARRGPDILVRTAPPLSATVDSPLGEVAKPPVSASNDEGDQASGVSTEMTPQAQAEARAAKVTDTTATEGDTDAKPADKAADADGEVEIMVDGKKVETPPYVKREITKARNQQRAAQAAAEEAKAAAKAATEALAALQAEHAALKAKGEPEKPAVEETIAPRPTRDKFDDPDAYDEAVIAWSKAEGVREAEAKLAADKAAAEAEAARTSQEAAQKAHTAKVAEIEAAWEARKAEAAQKYEDYEAVTTADGLIISDAMAAVIFQVDNGTDIAYHLGQNREESLRIASLPNVALQMMEIGRLSERLGAPKPRAARARPIEPIDTGSAPATDATREPSMEDYGASRTVQIQAARRPFMDRSAPPARAARH
jgi:hypothetical protein